jgi:uroporphyrinogen-III synthase
VTAQVGQVEQSTPLKGFRIVVTRARGQARELTDRLNTLGATVIELPAIEIVPVPTGPLDAAILRLDDYDWTVFTSANTVTIFLDRMSTLGVGVDALSQGSVAAIGSATAARLEERGVRVDFIPDAFIAESVVEGMAALGMAGRRVLLPRAEVARETLPDGLRAAGAIVDVVVAYRTKTPDDVDGDVVRSILGEGVDIVTFASPSAARNVVSLAGETVSGAAIVCIGPVTADAAREAGLRVDAIAGEHSIPGLVDAIVRLVESGAKEASDEQ